MTVSDELILLRRNEFRESSYIVTALGKTTGKVALLVRGARKPKSPFAGLLQVGTILTAQLYVKPTRSVQLLTEASRSVRLDGLMREMEKMAVTMGLMELCDQLLHDGEVNEPVFDFLYRFLPWMEEESVVRPALFPYLQVRLLQLSGLEMQIDSPEVEEEAGFLNVESGTLSSRSETMHAIRLTPSQYRFLISSILEGGRSTLRMELSHREVRSLIQALDRYFGYHLEGIRPRKSDAIFEQIFS